MTIDPDQVAQICYTSYQKSLETKSKPKSNEWTNLAAILMKENDNYTVLSMATGSKCLAEKQLPQDGSLVFDSHAEILARRCFLRYLYQEMSSFQNDSNYSSQLIVRSDSIKFSIKPNVQLILFSSHTPCGDASIIPMTKKRKELDDNSNDPASKKQKVQMVDDVHRTGAKCVPNSEISDTKEKGVGYHVTGVVRTKPGRGDPTKCMSCSDKMAKWLVLGIQGSLMSILMDKPIYLSAIVIGECPFDIECMNRALIDRSNSISNLPEGYSLTRPEILQSKLQFRDSKLAKNPDSIDNNDLLDDGLIACPNSVCWTRGASFKPLFVLVKGNLQGANPKKKNKSNLPPICKQVFLDSFKTLYIADDKQPMSYSTLKASASEYSKAADEFYRVYKDWLRIDRDKYYNFV